MDPQNGQEQHQAPVETSVEPQPEPTGGGGGWKQIAREKIFRPLYHSKKGQLVAVLAVFGVAGSTFALLTHAAAATLSLVPTSDVSISGVHGVSGSRSLKSNLYTTVDDGTSFTSADDNATYVGSPSGQGQSYLTEGFSSSRTGTVTQVVANMRARSSSTTKGTIQVLLMDGATLVGTGPVHALAQNYANFSDTFSSISLNSLSTLRAKVIFKNGANSGNLRMTQLWLDVTYMPSVPVVAIMAPVNGSTVSGTVAISGTASDPDGMSKVEIQVDGGAWQPATGTTNWSYSWDTTSLAGGNHTIAVRATDTTGTAGYSNTSLVVSSIANAAATKLGCTGQAVAPTGTTTVAYSDPAPVNSTFYDLTQWTSTAVTGVGSNHAIDIGGTHAPAGTCVLGGVVDGSIDPTLGWQYVHDSISGFGYRVFNTGNIAIDRIRVHNVEDGFKPRECDSSQPVCPDFINTGTFAMSRAYMTGIRDDSIENDEFMAGSITDSLFDGVWTFLSEQLQGTTSTSSATIGPNEPNTITIDGDLVRLAITNGGETGAGKWFKYQGAVAHHTPVISNSIFAVDAQPRLGWSSLDLPAGTVWNGTNNYILWLGTPGGYGGPMPAGVTFLEGQAALDKWSQARNDWLTAHGYATKDESDLNPMDDPVLAPQY